MLAVGTTAPDFTLRDQNHQPVSLSDYRGAKNVLLVFFPLAFTGICQGELDQLRDHLPDFENDDSAGAGHLGGAAADPQDLGDPEWLHLSGVVGLLAARPGQPGLRGVQQRRRLLQSRDFRRRPVRDHSVRGDETARRGPRPAAVDSTRWRL